MALYFAYRDPRVPWYAKGLLIAVVGYAISPIDLIPDFIPVVGYLDDLIIVPAGIYLALKLIPTGVMAECREKAKSEKVSSRVKWIGAGIMAAIWIVVLVIVIRLIRQAV